jgi:glycosyltransferase involved in cell wall biosynthesis
MMMENAQEEGSERIAWLLPDMGTGGLSFQHILCELTKTFPHTTVFTGRWPGYAAGFENTFTVQQVGATRYIEFGKTANGYAIGFTYVSPQIIRHLLQFKPQVIFANAFTAWTAIALLLKPIGGWKVIIVHEGGSPVYESSSATLRYQVRQLMVKLADAFVANSQAGQSYLLNVLRIPPKQVFTRPFLVPSLKALQHYSEAEVPQLDTHLKRPIFLFVGQIIPRKGLQVLLEACLKLKHMGYKGYTLMIVGDGKQQPELETFVQQSGLEEQVTWVGKVPYRFVGDYFKFADVFVFPTYDDIWGMVLVEAMAFGKPVICSVGAGASEMVSEGQNGFLFSPEQSEDLARKMANLIDDASLVQRMGDKSLDIMTKHTPRHAVIPFLEALKRLKNIKD